VFVSGTNTAAAGADGTSGNVFFGNPVSATVDTQGSVYLADYSQHTIRYITTSGVVTTFAGVYGSSGSTDGVGTNALFQNPAGIIIDTNQIIYVGDAGGVRKITSGGAFIYSFVLHLR
jgi:hypothetical protein